MHKIADEKGEEAGIYALCNIIIQKMIPSLARIESNSKSIEIDNTIVIVSNILKTVMHSDMNAMLEDYIKHMFKDLLRFGL